MTTLEKKLNNTKYACDICLKYLDENNNKPDQYVKTKRGTELFFHTACLDSLARMNKQYRYTL